LWLAVYDNRPDIVKKLLASGANANIKTKSGETVLNLAKFRSNHNNMNYTEIFKLFKNMETK
jgi:ankyrin repeat protein